MSRPAPVLEARVRAARILVVTGTGTGVGKTVTTAAIAALGLARGDRVAVLKPAQTGVGPDEPGDLAHVTALAPGITGAELARYPEPLAPATAARRAGRPPVTPQRSAAAARELAGRHDLVLVEGAGGLLVRFDDDAGTLAVIAALLDAPVLIVAAAGLGTLNHTALTVEALTSRSLTCAGIVIGEWPAAPGPAAISNLFDLPEITGVPLLGALPAGAGALAAAEFESVARHSLGPALGGDWQTPQP
jgi:dethiobiotin synthetase